MMIPTLYKYLPADGALSLIKNREFWFRCPLDYEPTDCRADLLENLDVHQVREAHLRELTNLLCGADAPPAPYRPEGLLLQLQRTRDRPWTPAEVEAVYGDLADNLFSDMDVCREQVRTVQELHLRDLRVLCLCENNESAAMWQNYDDAGRGACIGFRYVPEIDNALGAARQVQYVAIWPAIATPVEWARHVLFLSEIPFGKRARDALYIKQRKFADEQEWRIITKPPPGSGADEDGIYRVPIDAREIVEVILGPAMSATDEADLREAAQLVCPSSRIRRAAIELPESGV